MLYDHQLLRESSTSYTELTAPSMNIMDKLVVAPYQTPITKGAINLTSVVQSINVASPVLQGLLTVDL